MKYRVLRHKGQYYPQKHDGKTGWEYFLGFRTTRICKSSKEGAIEFCKDCIWFDKQKELPDKVLWSSDDI